MSFARSGSVLLCCMTLVSISGCGGGSSSGTVNALAPFQMEANGTTITASGQSINTDWSLDEYGHTTDIIAQNSINSSATLNYDSQGKITSIAVTTPYSSASWSAGNGEIYHDSLVAIGNSDSDFCIFIDPLNVDIDFGYQTFGVWQTGLDPYQGPGGAISFGKQTPDSAVPATGLAEFYGLTAGTYVDEDGSRLYLTISGLYVEADFSDRSLWFASYDTEKFNMLSLTENGLAPELDMRGTLSYDSGNNAFTGDVSTANEMSGTASGTFYGPNAEELGGVFALSGPGEAQYTGSFGAVSGM
ncbi:transferrin-binding protein-like solute binding protein [Desulfosediminicola sp.]|uniref:transferrin-binding protein-like solute binding protein n=1 Tax=Desulfosediminicola sp. TaxID=2886825 RepID=UPI003AF260D2